MKHAIPALLALLALAPAQAPQAPKLGGAQKADQGKAAEPAKTKAPKPDGAEQAQKPKPDDADEAKAPKQDGAQKTGEAKAPKPAQSPQAPKPLEAAKAPKAAQIQAPKPAQAPAQKPAQVAEAPKPARTAQAPKPTETPRPKPAEAPKQAQTAREPKAAQAPAQKAAEAPKPAQAPKSDGTQKAGQAQKQVWAKKPAQKAAEAPKPAQAPKSDGTQKAGQAQKQVWAKKPAQKASKKQSQKPAQREPLPAFQENPAVAEFAGRMAAKHGFDADALMALFSAVAPNARVLELFRPSPPRQAPSAPAKPVVKSWKKYRAVFLGESRIEGGVRFWRENAAALERAHKQYGVPPEIIVAIIGVETMYGERKGGFCVLEALASLAFHDPARGGYFMEELEHFLLLSRENGFDPLRPQGSYAGAIGIPQFMPGSWRRFAVDYDGDGKIDLDNSFADSIGSVANYLSRHGWKRGEPVAHRASLATADAAPDPAWAAAGMLPSLAVKDLRARGVAVKAPGHENAPEKATFIELPTPRMPTEYWLGYGNYYAITRYNKSHYYSMSVFLLAEEVRGRAGQ